MKDKLKGSFFWQLINRKINQLDYSSTFIVIDSDICTQNQSPNLCISVQKKEYKKIRKKKHQSPPNAHWIKKKVQSLPIYSSPEE